MAYDHPDNICNLFDILEYIKGRPDAVKVKSLHRRYFPPERLFWILFLKTVLLPSLYDEEHAEHVGCAPEPLLRVLASEMSLGDFSFEWQE